jgi:predicted ATPase
VVDQLNAGSTKIVSEDAKVSLISLNVEAAVIAAERSAYMSAQRYLLQALSFQPINIMWETEYELMLECSTLAAEMDLACGKYAEAINRVDQILRNATSIQDQHQALFTKVTALIATREIGLAHNLTINAIIALSSKFLAKPKKSHVNLEITRTSAALSSISEEQILGLQPMVIAIQTTEVKLLRILSWCSFRRGDGEMMAVTAFRIVQLTIVNGFCDVTPFAFAICGLVHCFLKNVKDASYFASLSIQGLERVTDTQITAQTLHVVWSFVGHLSFMPSEVHAGLLRSYTLAKLSGDSDLTFLCALNCCASSLLLGSENLEVVLGFIRTAFDDTSQKNYKDTDNNIYRILFQASNNIATSSSFPCRLTGEIMAEEIMLQDALEKNDDLTHYALWYVKLLLCAIFDQWEAAEDLVDKINESHKCLQPHFSLFHYWMLAGLTYTIRYNITKKRKYRRNIKLFRKQLNDAIEKGVASCEPMFALLLAEESALSGNLTTIMNSFDFAANSFAKDKRFNYQALTYERASRNILRLFPSNLSDAQRYVMKARQAYVSWGANCKVAFIDEEIIRRRGPSSSSTTQNDSSTHVSESCDEDGSTKIVNG